MGCLQRCEICLPSIDYEGCTSGSGLCYTLIGRLPSSANRATTSSSSSFGRSRRTVMERNFSWRKTKVEQTTLQSRGVFAKCDLIERKQTRPVINWGRLEARMQCS